MSNMQPMHDNDRRTSSVRVSQTLNPAQFRSSEVQSALDASHGYHGINCNTSPLQADYTPVYIKTA